MDWIKTIKNNLFCVGFRQPYRIAPSLKVCRLSSRVLSAKAAVGSRPPHTEQGKNKEKPIFN
ncbi:MAG: hypothetical protein ACOCNG_08090, partial [Bacteroidales bacterium]